MSKGSNSDSTPSTAVDQAISVKPSNLFTPTHTVGSSRTGTMTVTKISVSTVTQNTRTMYVYPGMTADYLSTRRLSNNRISAM